MIKQVKEAAEQKALVARCRREGIFIVCTENSLNFPIASLIHFLTPLVTEACLRRFKEHLRKLLCMLTRQRIEMGMEPGYPDLFVPQLRLYIEMKRRDGGIVSVDQRKVHEILKTLGYVVIVANGAKEAWDEIQRIKSSSIT